jgi:hypothetical protein
MKTKRTCKKIIERQKKIEEIKTSMAKLQALGLVGETSIIDGDIGWEIGIEHQAKLQTYAQALLGHPERWGEVPAFKGREAELYAMRDKAIRSGYIKDCNA